MDAYIKLGPKAIEYLLMCCSSCKAMLCGWFLNDFCLLPSILRQYGRHCRSFVQRRIVSMTYTSPEINCWILVRSGRRLSISHYPEICCI